MSRASEPRGELPVVLAITGASGGVYAARLLQSILVAGVKVHLVVSESGQAVLQQELGATVDVNNSEPARAIGSLLRAHDAVLDLGPQATEAALDAAGEQLCVHAINDYFTPIASGSHQTRGMVICPCSGSTLSAIAHSASQNLVQRAAEVHLKERRKLVIVPRETPLSTFQLENMHRLSQAGAVVLPAAPGWYHGVTRLADLVDFVVGRVLDQFDIPNDCIQRWASDV